MAAAAACRVSSSFSKCEVRLLPKDAPDGWGHDFEPFFPFRSTRLQWSLHRRIVTPVPYEPTMPKCLARLGRIGYTSHVSDVTHILTAIEQGDANAADKLLPLVYEELRKLAAHKMANEAAGQTLQPTALVHEAWMRLVGSNQQCWENRAHFFGAAAEAMRRILVDHARRKQSQ